MARWTERSSDEVGSSRMTRLGLRISARAMAMRWRWPPEKASGRAKAGRRVDPDLFQRLSRAHRRARRRSSPARAREVPRRRSSPTLESRRERSERVLEDHLHAPAQGTQRAFVHRLKIAAFETDRAPRRDEPEKRARQRRLARAGLADDPEGAAARADRGRRRRARAAPAERARKPPPAVIHGQRPRRQEHAAVGSRRPLLRAPARRRPASGRRRLPAGSAPRRSARSPRRRRRASRRPGRRCAERA